MPAIPVHHTPPLINRPKWPFENRPPFRPHKTTPHPSTTMRANLTLSLAWRLASVLAGDVMSGIRGDRLMRQPISATTRLSLRDCCDLIRGLPKSERKPVMYAMKYIARRELADTANTESRRALRRDLRAAITHARTLATPEAA